MADVTMRIMLAAQAGNTLGVIRSVTNALGDAGLAGGLALAGAAVAGVAVALGVTAVKAAADFQSQTERLVTSAGELQSNLDLVRQGLLQMSIDTGTSTEQLAAGMYYVESAGFHAAAGLQVMEAAAQGAKSENADLDVVAKALTTEMIDYHMAAGQASEAMNGLIAAVQNGKTNLQDLASSMGNVLPIASSLGISFPQVAGAMDTMTNAGMSSRQAAMNLAHVLLALSAPSAVAEKSMKAVGLSAQEVKDTLVNQGLPEALQMIEDQVGKKFPAGSVAYEQALKSILGGIIGVKLAAQLTGDNLKMTEQNVAKVAAAMQSGHGTVLGFAEVQQTLNFKLAQVGEAAHALLIVLGTALLPVVTSIVGAVTPVISNFAAWLTQGNKLQVTLQNLGNVLHNIAGFIGNVVSVGASIVNFFRQNQIAALALLIPLGMISAVLVQMAVTAIVAFLAGLPALIAGFVGWAITAGAAAIATLAATWPLLAIGAAIAIVIGIIILLVTHWKQVTDFLKGVWNTVVNWLIGTLHTIGDWFSNTWNGIVARLKIVWAIILASIKAYLDLLVSIFTWPFRMIGQLFEWLYQHNTYFQRLVDAIRRIVSVGLQWLQMIWQVTLSAIVAVWNWIVGVATTVWNAVSGAVRTAVNAVVGWLRGVWNTVIGWLSDRWNSLKAAAQKAWDGVTGVFKGVWSAISGTLSTLWSNISGWFSNLATQAIQWGTNMITGFINGIKNSLGNLGKTLGDAAKTVANFLGFHSPTKLGAGADADTWAPNLIKMYAAGLQKSLPALQTSLALVMRPVGSALGGQGLAASRPAPSVVNSGHTFNIQLSTMARSQTEMQRVVDLFEQEVGRRMLGQTPGYSTGGWS